MKNEKSVAASEARSWALSAIWKKLWQWAVIAGLAVAALLLGLIGFAKYFAATGETRSFFDIFYRVLQLFVLESGWIEQGAVPWQLQMARFVAPVVPAWAIVKALVLIFREQIEKIRLRFTRGHVVICGLGRKGMELVRDFRRHGDRVVVIESNAESRDVRACRDLGVTVLIGNAADKSLLREARVQYAKDIVAISGRDGTNVGIAVLSCELVTERKDDVDSIVRCFVHIFDLKLCALFRQHRVFTEMGDKFDARVFDMYENAARLLLRDWPLDRDGIGADDPREVHVIVVGLGHLGESLAVHAAQTGHFANGKPIRITVIDKEIAERRHGFSGRCGRFERVCEASFVEGDIGDPEILNKVEEWTRETEAITTIVICLDDDSSSLSSALNVLPKVEEFGVPVLVRMGEESGLAALLVSGYGGGGRMANVHPFGMIKDICTRKMLLDEELDTLARAIHGFYAEERIKEGMPETDPSVLPWDQLDMGLKDSNRQQADHIPVKLRAIGGYSSSTETGSPAVETFEDDEVELLAKMEHARYCAERILAGWTLGPRDPEKKTSPYLVPWGEVPENVREYDRQAVRNIPRLLALIGERVYRR